MQRKHVTALLGFLTTGLLMAAFIETKSAVGPWKVVAWNDLGMHCMDSDYSVFSILPPFNTVYAQVIDSNGELVTDDATIEVTYEAVADPTGSINKSSVGKTNYWEYADDLFGGSTVPDTGLLGNDMPGAANVPQPMEFQLDVNAFVAEGIPITPYDDAGHRRTYPLMRIVVRDAQGSELCSTTPVLPVSDELDCRICHGSGAQDEAEPAAGWVFDPRSERDYRLNILALHDDKHLGDADYQDALAQTGLSAAGLYDSAENQGRPVLCASCHASNALPGTGVAGITQLTTAVHAGHADAVDPTNGMTLDMSANRSSCYRCHPGSETRCLRGAMGGAVDPDGELAMQCQSCHGTMSDVGSDLRQGWLDEPNCQACHTGTALANNGQIRYTNAYEPSGLLRQAVDPTFATNPDTPAAGISLYRFSEGHGGLQCSACHGSTHAVYPATHPNDGIQPAAFQGHGGTLVECSACHVTEFEVTTDGPHGMHPVGDNWVRDHGDEVGRNGFGQCQACHGLDDSGTVLSYMHADRTMDTKTNSRLFFCGSRIGCYACHNGPDDADETSNRDPVVTDAFLVVEDDPVPLTLAATDADGDPLELRIVDQPHAGRVGLVGTTATYYPDPGFAGTDVFTYAAWDGAIDSNLGTVTVQRNANQANYGLGYPGTGGLVPAFIASGNPKLGTVIDLDVANDIGVSSVMFVVSSTERAGLQTNRGGVLLTEPLSISTKALPASGFTIPFKTANDPSLIGLSLYGQVVIFDPGASFSFSFSQGLRLTFGL